MDIREQILAKYKEFNEFLMGVSIENLRKQFNRHELNTFKGQLYDAKLRSLAYEISKTTDEMKKEEFPQLLGVHHFPIINEIDFLTGEQKIELDKELVRYRVGDYIGSFWRLVRDESRRKQLIEWLLSKGILETKHVVICPHCCDGHASNIMTTEEKNNLDSMFMKYKEAYDEELEEKLLGILEYVCMECDYHSEVDDYKELTYKDFYQMKTKRDSSLDKA